MKRRFRLRGWYLPFLLAAAFAYSQEARKPIAFTVSMPQPGNHIYHVTLRCEGLKGTVQHFKMPVWSLGYYGIREFAKQVRDFPRWTIREEISSGNTTSAIGRLKRRTFQSSTQRMMCRPPPPSLPILISERIAVTSSARGCSCMSQVK